MNIDDIAPYTGPNSIDGLQFRAARAALDVTSFGMNVLDFAPDTHGHPEHDHAHDGQEEVYVVLTGTVFLRTPEGEQQLDAGSMVRVGPEVKRQLVTRGAPARVLALGATPGKAFEVTM